MGRRPASLKARSSVHYLTIEDIYVRCFDRPPAVIYAEATRPPSDRVLEISLAAAYQVREELARFPESERGIAGWLPAPWCDEWLSATPGEKERLSDLACQMFLYYHTFADLQRWPALTAHIQKIWTLKEEGRGSAQRNAARDRLLRIFDLPHEDQRRDRPSPNPDPRDVARRYDTLLSPLRLLRRTRLRDRTPPREKALTGSVAPARSALASILSQLRSLFPEASDGDLESLARQIRRPGVPLRDVINGAIAREFGRRPGDLKTLVARGHHLLKADRNVLCRRQVAWAGYDRLVAWCAAVNVKPPFAPPSFARPQ